MDCPAPPDAAWPRGAGTPFAGRVALATTRHAKDQAIAPVLLGQLGLHVLTYISAERSRAPHLAAGRSPANAPGDALRRAAREKARRLFARVPAASLVVAGAGAAVPHPARPGIVLDRELVLLTTRPGGDHPQHEFVGEAVGASTAGRHAHVRSVAEALAVAPALGFPVHGLVVHAAAAPPGGRRCLRLVAHAVVEADALADAVRRAVRTAGAARLEPDRRVHMNPTRFGVVARAAEALAAVVRRACPVCGCPGFAAARCAACGHVDGHASGAGARV